MESELFVGAWIEGCSDQARVGVGNDSIGEEFGAFDDGDALNREEVSGYAGTQD